MLVSLSSNKTRRGQTASVHILVLEAFVGPKPKGMEGCHYDGDFSNNKLENLRWDTHLANEADKKRHGTGNVGIRNPAAKLSEDDVREIRRLYATGKFSMSKLARMYNISVGNVHPIIRRVIWKHVV